MAETNNELLNYEVPTPIPEVPETVDPNRPPQHNEANIGCHCACACSRAAADSGGGDAVQQAADDSTRMNEKGVNGYESDTSSECGDHTVGGDEGAEEHLIDAADLGLHSKKVISRAIARRSARCICHRSILPSSNDYPFTPVPSGLTTPGDSAMADTDSEEPSLTSSQSLSITSHGSSVFAFAFGGFAQEALMQRLPVLYAPLRLTSDVSFEYPLELDISAEDFGDYDLW